MAEAEGVGERAGSGELSRRRERWAFAVRERLPLWLRARCGMEPRTVVALTVVLIVAAVLAGRHFWTGRPEPVRAPEVVAEAVPSGAAQSSGVVGESGTGAETGAAAGERPAAGAPFVVVDVSGKVRRPGVLRLPAGSRVADALTAAGGARPGTDLTALNRARILMDGEHVVVGAVPGPVGGQAPGVPGSPGAVGSVGSSGSSGNAGSVGGAAGPVSLNTATVEQLDTLPGVGPVLAQHIVDYRTQHGGFRSVDQLRDVNGIGERRFADLQPLVRP
ncbi:helix-hairpin-helix domain-containing protein [Streptomyces sp. NPDC015131]|uniref:helix-hairpin-helix domain-containing protein n=1 Tax=Streptomyces sp. NPDC015131 TaxID=3364941 RepID=UPI0036F7F2F0